MKEFTEDWILTPLSRNADGTQQIWFPCTSDYPEIIALNKHSMWKKHWDSCIYVELSQGLHFGFLYKCILNCVHKMGKHTFSFVSYTELIYFKQYDFFLKG